MRRIDAKGRRSAGLIALDAPHELINGDTDHRDHHDQAQEARDEAKNRPRKHEQPPEEECDEQQQDAAEPGQITGLDQSEEQRKSCEYDQQPARNPVQQHQNRETLALQRLAAWAGG